MSFELVHDAWPRHRFRDERIKIGSPIDHSMSPDAPFSLRGQHQYFHAVGGLGVVDNVDKPATDKRGGGAAAIDLLFANVSATPTIGLSNCVSSQLLGLSCRVDLRPRAKWLGGPRSSSSVCVLRLW
jgi:hypothetical protein